VSRSDLGPTQPPVQRVPGGPFPGAKARQRRDLPLTIIQCPGRKCVGAIYPLPPSSFVACSGTALALVSVFTTADLQLRMTVKWAHSGLGLFRESTSESSEYDVRVNY
jgi:hypothetical protein